MAQLPNSEGGSVARSGSPGESLAPSTAPAGDLAPRVAAAVDRARTSLLSAQRRDGHWCGELVGDSVLESEYVLVLLFLDRLEGERPRKAAARIRRFQKPDGAWPIFPGGPDDVSASVKAYFVLKLLGDDPDAPHMARARRRILELGGVEAANTYTKIYLALFGQYPWDRCPAIPPEMMLLSESFPFNVQEMSAWSRSIFVPLSILWAHRPVRPVPEGSGIPELRTGQPPAAPPVTGDDARERAWVGFFLAVDLLLKLVEKSGFRPLRSEALDAAESWIEERVRGSDGLGAIFPGIANTLMAYRCLGRPADHPVVRDQLQALEKLIVEGEERLRVQPALSPVWDTAQATVALRDAGVDPDRPELLRSARWLLQKESSRAGDWAYDNPGVEPSGWYFEYANEQYPDCDDTAEVLLALGALEPGSPDLHDRIEEARERGLRWLLSMQNEDGGWAAFNRGRDREPLSYVPFADHNAMLDPSCPDITGRVLELLSREGYGRSHPAVRRAVAFLRREQEADGTWKGRWGCNYLYGTWLALTGLSAAGEDLSGPRYRRTVRWLVDRQNADGGWGESLRSYEDGSYKGRGRSTASQTAWGLMALVAAGEAESEAARRAVEYLLEGEEDGAWDDPRWTGTGFPGVFYLRYELYDDYFPLLALARYRDAVTGRDAGQSAGRGSTITPVEQHTRTRAGRGHR